MRAILETACGCSKLIVIPEFTQSIRLPLARRKATFEMCSAELVDDPLCYREFRYSGHQGHEPLFFREVVP